MNTNKNSLYIKFFFKRILNFQIMICFLFILNNSILGQSLLKNLPATNGPVYTIVTSDDTVYFGGEFTSIGEATGRAILLDKYSGKHDKSFPAVDGYVHTVVPDDSGGWYIGGNFTKVGEYTRMSIAHIRADNTVDEWLPTVTNSDGSNSGDVFTIVPFGDRIYFGGYFSYVDGEPRQGVAAVDRLTGKLLPWNPKTDGAVYGIQLSDRGTVFLGGPFLSLQDGSIMRIRLAEVDTSTNAFPTSFNLNIDGELTPGAGVWGIYLTGDTLFVYGDFYYVGNTIRRYGLCAIDITNENVLDWEPTAFGDTYLGYYRFYDLKIKGDTVFVAGIFQNVADLQAGEIIPSTGLAAFSRSTKTSYLGSYPVLYPWHPSITGFNTLPNYENRIAVYSISINGNTLYAAGTFEKIDGIEAQNVAAFDLTTGKLKSWNPHLGSVRNPGFPKPGLLTVSTQDDCVLLGGNVNLINAVNRTSLGAIKISNGEILPWYPKVSSRDTSWLPAITSMAKYNNEIYISGTFDTLNSQFARGLVVVDNDSGKTLFDINMIKDPTLKTENIGWAKNMLIWDNKLYFGGGFFKFGDSIRYSLASYDLINHKLTSWNPNEDPDSSLLNTLKYNGIYSMTLKDSVLYLSHIQKLGQQNRGGLGAVNAITGEILDWNPTSIDGINGLIRNVYFADGKIFVAGGFTRINNIPRKYIAAIDPVSGEILPWNAPDMVSGFNTTTGIPGLYSLASIDSILIIGGAITEVGSAERKGVAFLNIHTGELLNINETPSASSTVETMHFSSFNHKLFFGGTFENFSNNPHSFFAGWDMSSVVDVKPENQNLPAEYSLFQNYPNPFNPVTTIKYHLPERNFVKIKVYDIIGKEVTTLINSMQDAGSHSVLFNASELASGVYFYSIESGNFRQVKKMLLLK